MSNGTKYTPNGRVDVGYVTCSTGHIWARGTNIIESDSAIWAFSPHRPRPPGLPPTPGTIQKSTSAAYVVWGCLYGVGKFGNPNWVWNGGNVWTTDTRGATPAMNAVKAKALAKFTGGDVDLGDTLADLKDTINTVAKRGRQLANLFNEVSKSKGSRVKSLAGLSLEQKFVFGQLVEDIFGLAQSVGNRYIAGSNVSKTSGSSSRKSVDHGFPGNTPVPDFQASNIFGPMAQKVSAGGSVDSPLLATLNSWGLANPASFLEQRVPLSFVADWWLGINDYLKAITAFVGLSHTWTCCTGERRTVYAVHGYWFKGTQLIQRDTPWTAPSVEFHPLARAAMMNWTADKLGTASALLLQHLR